MSRTVVPCTLMESPSGASLMESVRAGYWVAARIKAGGGPPQRIWLKVILPPSPEGVHAQLCSEHAILAGDVGRVFLLEPKHIHAVAKDHP